LDRKRNVGIVIACRYNVTNGGPAPESLTDAIYARTTKITQIHIAQDFPAVDINQVGRLTVKRAAGAPVTVEVIDSVEDYAALLSRLFDFTALRALVARADFSMAYDALSGVAGVYAQARGDHDFR
jgi:phosphoglucomutase